MDDTGTICQRVARARKLRDLNQEQLASRMHVSKSLVTQVERGHKPTTQAFVTLDNEPPWPLTVPNDGRSVPVST